MTESKDKLPLTIVPSWETQPSLFRSIKENIDWNLVKHPIDSLKDGWKAPRNRPSLFHYLDEEAKTHLTFKEFFVDLFTGFKNPLFIPSVFSDPEGLARERAQGRTRKLESSMVSLVVHVLIVVLLIWVATLKSNKVDENKDNAVFVSNPVYMPYQGDDDKDGGGGGGGGKNQPMPPATGRMAETQRVQLVPPDPDNPKPLLPADELLAQTPSVQMPIDIPQDQSIPIGDISAPPNYSMSSGPGTGGGIGTGVGSGIGPGKGSGVGPGEGGGMGGGKGGGIGSGEGPYVVGSGVKEPVPLVQPLPPYTEEARKKRTEGIVVLEAIIRRDGTVDSFKVVRGLGDGLDESAINTIATKWRFRPGTLKGTPVDVRANIEVRFRMF
jgi:periplasmic protein TonB